MNHTSYYPISLLTVSLTLFFAASISLALLLFGASAYALSTDFLFSFGSAGAGNGQFNEVEGVALNGTHIFVADFSNNRVQIFDLSGNFVAKFGSPGAGDGQFNGPNGITNNGTNIFVTDQNNHRVQIFDLSGNFVAKFGSLGAGDGQFNTPHYITRNSTHLFVADDLNHRVQIFDLSGNFVAKFGSPGAGDGQFNRPLDVYVANNRIYVTEFSNNRVQIFDLSGNFVAKFGSPGAGDGQFNRPYGIAVNSYYIFVTDSLNHRVQIFDLSGNFVAKFGTLGADPGQINNPSELDISSDRIYVVDYGNERINVYGMPPNPNASEYTGSGGGCGGDCIPPTLGVDSTGRRLVTDGFTYNNSTVDVEYYYTPYQLITTEVGKNNTATFKIYENGGSENIAHFDLAFGLADGQILAQSNARIEWDRTFDGIESITLHDPQNVFGNVTAISSTGTCNGGAIQCLILDIHHTFLESPESDIIATNVWDHSRNAWQNYYNHGIHITGESLNPPDTYTGIHRGHMYHLTETDKNTTVDELGNTWSFEYNTWSMDYVYTPRPQDGSWQVLTRYHSGFEDYKKEQTSLAEITLDGILGYKDIQNPNPAYIPGPQPGTDKRQTAEFFNRLHNEILRAETR